MTAKKTTTIAASVAVATTGKTFEQLMASITVLKDAEKITRETLSELSRDLLGYYLDSSDVRPINRLLGQDGNQWILTPINHRVASQYFHHFLPSKSNFDDARDWIVKGEGKRTALVFGKKNPKTFDGCLAMIQLWLQDDANDIWVWSNDIRIEKPAIDYAKRIQNSVQKAMEDGGFSMLDVMKAIVGIEGVLPSDMMKAIEVAFAPSVEPVAVEAFKEAA